MAVRRSIRATLRLDKVVRPSSVTGASKRIAEMLVAEPADSAGRQGWLGAHVTFAVAVQ